MSFWSCEQPPADGPARKEAARLALEAVVGPFPSAPAGGDNGRRLRAALAPLAVQRADRPLLRRLMQSAVADWEPADREAFEVLLEKRSAALETLRSAADARPGGLGIPVPPPEESFPDLRPLLDACRLLALDGRSALAGGDSARAASDARMLGVLLDSGYREPWLMAQLVGGAGERNLDALLADALALGDAVTLTELGTALERLDSVPALAWMAGEASLAERSFSRRAEDPESKQFDGFDAAYADVVVARLYERYAEVAHALAGGWQTFRPWSAAMERRSAESAADSPGFWRLLTMSRTARAEGFADAVADLLWSGLVGGIEKAVATRSARQLARLAIDLDRQGRESGTLPAQLDLSAWRHDYLGETPSYERRADGSARLSLPMTAESWRRDFGADVLAPRLEWEVPDPQGRRTARTFPLPPPPQKN